MSGERILMLVSFANLGGAQIAALRLARGLRDRGHDPRVVFLYEASPIPAPDHPYEVLVKAPSLGLGGYLAAMRGLARLMRTEKPHRVLTFMPLASALGQAAAFLAGAERRVVSHRVPVWSIRRSLNVLDRLWAWLGIYTDVVAVSEGVRASCHGYPSRLMRRTVVVHNGLFGWRPSALSRNEARARAGLAPGTLALVAVGRLAPQKNYPLMLRVMQQLDDAVLIIAGDGPDRAALAHDAVTLGVASKVRFLGSVDRSAIPDLLAAADVFVQPSTFEGQSNAILEALEAGLPIVAHDIPEQRETIADPDGTSAGALVPLGDVAAWVGAIERLRADATALRAARAVAARRARLFGFDAMVSGFERVLTRS